MAKEQIITGIDIGSSKIATVIATLSPEGKISVIGVSTVRSRGMKKGVVVDIDEAVEAIAESLEAAERMAGYAVSSAFVLVDGTHVTSLNSHGVVAASNPEGEIGPSDVARVTEAAQAISIPSSREIIHVIPRGFIVDSQDGVRDPVGMSGIRLEVRTNIISGSTTVMRNLVKCVQQVGVDVDDLVYGGLASSESTLTDTEKELGAVLVDIGGGTTDVLIFEGGSPAYAAVLPIGGQNITNDLAVGLRTSLEDAERIKVKLSDEKRSHDALGPSEFASQEGDLAEGVGTSDDEIDISDLGLEVTTLPKKMLYDIIEARLDEIFSLIALEIKKSNLTSKLPAGVVVCGGSSQTIGVSKVARKVLDMPVRLGLPSGVTGLIDEISGPAYAASVGLLLYGSEQGVARRVGIANIRTRVTAASSALVDWIKSFIP